MLQYSDNGMPQPTQFPLLDAVIFCGSGSTAAIAKLASILRLDATERREKRQDAYVAGSLRDVNPAPHPLPLFWAVVLHGPMEHHSNILLWREDPGGTWFTKGTTDKKITKAAQLCSSLSTN